MRDRSSQWLPNELRWLAKQIRPFVASHVASFLCMTVASMLTLLTPLVLKWLIDQILPQRETGLLFAAAILIFLGYQGRTALMSVGNYLTLNAVQRLALRLRMDVLRHVDQLSADRIPPGSLSTFAVMNPGPKTAKKASIRRRSIVSGLALRFPVGRFFTSFV